MNRWRLFGQPKTLMISGEVSGAGYTIMEVLVVLAVTTMMFVAIAASFSGRQGRAMFTQAVHNYEARIQTVANDVVSGRFDGGGQCFVDSSTAAAGSNKSCIFLGKLLVARADETEMLTLVGRRTQALSPADDVTTLAQAEPEGLQNSGSDVKANTFGLQVRKIYVLNAAGAPTTQVGAFGFLSELSGGLGSAGSSASGSHSLRLYGLNNTTAPVTEDRLVTLGKIDATSLVPLPNGIRICIVGSNGQRAQIVLGAGNNQTTLTTDIYESNNLVDCPGA